MEGAGPAVALAGVLPHCGMDLLGPALAVPPTRLDLACRCRYGGCEGNANNFESAAQCEAAAAKYCVIPFVVRSFWGFA